jgi:hypothetical protein
MRDGVGGNVAFCRLDPNRDLHYHPHPERVSNEARKVAGRCMSPWLPPWNRVASQPLGREWGTSSLRALCPPMIDDPNGLLGADLKTRKITENYGRAIIMACQ